MADRGAVGMLIDELLLERLRAVRAARRIDSVFTSPAKARFSTFSSV